MPSDYLETQLLDYQSALCGVTTRFLEHESILLQDEADQLLLSLPGPTVDIEHKIIWIATARSFRVGPLFRTPYRTSSHCSPSSRFVGSMSAP